MEDIKFFQVTVKLEEETDMVDKVGNPKIRKWSEDYLVRATRQGKQFITRCTNIVSR